MKQALFLLPLLPFCAALADEAPKPPPRCISATDISNTEVVDDFTILFHMGNGKIWKSTMADRCYGLGFERAISYEVWGGEICGNAQIIHVLHRGTFCNLGPFEAYTPPPKEGDTSPKP